MAAVKPRTGDAYFVATEEVAYARQRHLTDVLILEFIPGESDSRDPGSSGDFLSREYKNGRSFLLEWTRARSGTAATTIHLGPLWPGRFPASFDQMSLRATHHQQDDHDDGLGPAGVAGFFGRVDPEAFDPCRVRGRFPLRVPACL